MEKIPITIISGFLGSGKTTLLNHILTESHGRRIAVLVNDFGEINIDAELITNISGETISLANGCVCCTIRGDLVNTVTELLEAPELPEHIVIEVSGVSDPNAAAMSFVMSTTLAAQVQLDGIISVVDADQFDSLSNKYRAHAADQVEASDVVIFNKTDLASNSQLEELKTWARETAPAARTLEAVNCVVPLPMILGTGHSQIVPDSPPEAHSEHEHENDHSKEFSTSSWVSHNPLGFKAIYTAFKTLSLDIFRAKGFLYLGEVPDKCVIVQMVGRRVTLSKGPAWDGETPISRIVVIGAHDCVDSESLSKRFESCKYRESDGEPDPLSNAVIEILREPIGNA
ncbi:MAG: CobW family GTP-binding protein [Pseudomonadales bacterium]